MNATSVKYAARFVVVAAMLAAASYGCSDDEGETTSTTSGASSSSSSSGTGGAGGNAACFEAGGGYGGFGNICMTEASDGACLACTRGNCCTEVTNCETEDNCRCLLQCFLENCDAVACLQLCGQSPEVSALTTCAATNCQSECVQQ